MFVRTSFNLLHLVCISRHAVEYDIRFIKPNSFNNGTKILGMNNARLEATISNSKKHLTADEKLNKSSNVENKMTERIVVPTVKHSPLINKRL